MNYNFIQTEIKNHVFTLILNREVKRNAFTPTTVNEIAHALNWANENDSIHVLVLKANGPIFCAGMDLKTFQNRELDTLNPDIENENISLGEVFDNFNKPSIAVIEGDVIAGGFLYVLGCTYVFARRGVNFKLPEISLGIFPFQVMAGLRRILPEKKVLQLCLDSNPFNTDIAIELGLVDGYLEKIDLDTFVGSFAEKSGFATKAGIQALKTIRDMDSSKQYNFLLDALDKLRDREEVMKFIDSKLKKN